ncbi:UNKNOWN [Stylonychia lemnae]|uniref:TLDc domain-containing protein n=1 Tax=Stylonychia lemnae TaxID=5949 RepID=A0A078AWW4_STYLE|nr:UNKNOWN [Stylonychia lemnae]|eukprot:CDW85747.1 UNKNOWN [Stylonychia lemnae]
MPTIFEAKTLPKITKMPELNSKTKEQPDFYHNFRQLVDLQLKKESSFIFRQQFDELKTQISFKQIYVGSRDGFRAENFHSKCNSRGPTVCFILSETGNKQYFFLNSSIHSQTVQKLSLSNWKQ